MTDLLHKVPPQDLSAEAAVLGSIILDNQEYSSVCEIINAKDFYNFANQVIFSKIEKIISLKQIVDTITLSSVLKAAGKLDQCGGPSYLASLTENVSSSSMAKYYAEIVKERSLRRQAIKVGDDLLKRVYDQSSDLNALLPEIQQALVTIVTRNGSKMVKKTIQQEVEEWLLSNTSNEPRCSPLLISLLSCYYDLGYKTKEEKASCRMAFKRLSEKGLLEHQGGRSGMYRILNGAAEEIDYINADDEPFEWKCPLKTHELVNIYPGSVILIAGEGNSGKGHPDGTNILTVQGWKVIEDIKIGEEIFTQDGSITKVVGVYPRGEQQCFKFNFNDRTSVMVDSEHLWAIIPSYNNGRIKKYKIVESHKILSMVGGFRTIPSHLRCRIPKNDVLQYDSTEVPVDPYLMGVMLGDGTMSRGTPTITTNDDEIISYCQKTWRVGTILADKRNKCVTVSLLKMAGPLRSMGMEKCHSWDKFIPTQYLYNSLEVRLPLLQGIMDTDGDISKSGKSVSFTTASKQLSEDVAFLVRSLGGKVTISTKNSHYLNNGIRKEGRLSYRLFITLKGYCPFKLKRKAERYHTTTKTDHKHLIKIENAGIQKTTCIAVEHPSGLYIIDGFIVTHNTAYCLNVGKQYGIIQSEPVNYFSSEMEDIELKARLKKFDLPLDKWKNVRFVQRHSNFAEVIKPDQLNIVDYLEVFKDFYEVAGLIRGIKDKIGKGIVVIAIQKPPGRDEGVGGQSTKNLARLYIALSPGKAKIVKGKMWASIVNPDGMAVEFKLVGGAHFQVKNTWQKESKPPF